MTGTMTGTESWEGRRTERRRNAEMNTVPESQECWQDPSPLITFDLHSREDSFNKIEKSCLTQPVFTAFSYLLFQSHYCLGPLGLYQGRQHLCHWSLGQVQILRKYAKKKKKEGINSVVLFKLPCKAWELFQVSILMLRSPPDKGSFYKGFVALWKKPLDRKFKWPHMYSLVTK